MFAVIETGGKQYKINEGLILDVEKLDIPEKEKIVFDKVLLVTKDDKVLIGQPYVAGAKVTATVLENYRDKKITVFKFKRKTGYKRTKGHRQNLTRLKFEEIKIGTEKKPTVAAKKEPPKKKIAVEKKGSK
jgi:large subunit ribosomal protein L21